MLILLFCHSSSYLMLPNCNTLGKGKMLIDGSSGTEFPAAVVNSYTDLKDEEM